MVVFFALELTNQTITMTIPIAITITIMITKTITIKITYKGFAKRRSQQR